MDDLLKKYFDALSDVADSEAEKGKILKEQGLKLLSILPYLVYCGAKEHVLMDTIQHILEVAREKIDFSICSYEHQINKIKETP